MLASTTSRALRRPAIQANQVLSHQQGLSASVRSLSSAAAPRRNLGKAPVRTSASPCAQAWATPSACSSSSSLLSRGMHGSRAVKDTDKPTHASTEDHVIPYPEDHERDPDDVGHNLTGGNIGPHNKRTLATFSMESKVCVVTGAARGLGNLIARTFIESGSNALAILDLNAAEAVQAAKDVEDWFLEHGQTSPGEIHVAGFGCDVSNEDNVMRVMAEIKEKFGRIDVVVNSAGIVENFPATQYPTHKIRKLMEINVLGSYFVAREAAKHMLADGTKGSIVLIASMSGLVVNIPQPQAPYNASKAAVAHLAKSLAVEWAKAGIRVNSLSPGYMETSLVRTVLESSPAGKELRETWENLTPLGRMGVPEDLKGAAIYLASDASMFTTATDLVVDGGYTAT